MKKYVLIILSICSFQTHAMEVVETDQEFIDRTKQLTIPNVNDKYLIHLPAAESYQYRWIYSARCPNNNIIAILQCGVLQQAKKHDPLQNKATLAVIDKKNNTLLHREELDYEKYFKIAVSRDGNIIAALYPETPISKPHQHTTDYDYEDVLTIINLNTQKTEFIDIPYNLKTITNHPTIAFNKQGTCIIVHGKDRNAKPNFDGIPSCHAIYPVTVATQDPDYAVSMSTH